MWNKIVKKIKERRTTFFCCIMFFLLLDIYLYYMCSKANLVPFSNCETGSFNKGLLCVFGLLLIIFLTLIVSGVISLYYSTIDDLLKIEKLHAVIISIITFFMYRIFFIVKYQGFFSFDEFYHISTLNSDYVTDYARARYINFMEKIICNIFGQTDFTVKLVPFILGTVSFLCGLYLLYKIYNKPYWILTISSILIFMPYIAYNHFYIRMYVFLEAVVMIDCLLIYNAEVKRGTKWGVLYIVLAEVLTILYSANTKDFSAKALFILVTVAGLYYFFRNAVKVAVGKYLVVRIGGMILFICLVIAVGYIIAAKQHWIKTSFLESDFLIKLMGINLETFYHADDSAFLKFIFGKYFYISIPFCLSCVYVWKQKIEFNKILFIIAGLPLLGYMVLLYNSHLLRTYIAFFPIVCILSFLAADKLKLSNLQHLAIVIVATVLILNIEDSFWESPSIPYETNSCNLGEAVAIARNLEQEGYKIVTLMTYETQSAYFDLLEADTNLNQADLKYEIRRSGKSYTGEEEDILASEMINNKLLQILSSDIQQVIIADVNGTGRLKMLGIEDTEGKKYKKINLEGATSVVIVN